VATTQNHSRYRVTIKNNDSLTREFAFSVTAEVKAYVVELRKRGLKPRAVQFAAAAGAHL